MAGGFGCRGVDLFSRRRDCSAAHRGVGRAPVSSRGRHGARALRPSPGKARVTVSRQARARALTVSHGLRPPPADPVRSTPRPCPPRRQRARGDRISFTRGFTPRVDGWRALPGASGRRKEPSGRTPQARAHRACQTRVGDRLAPARREAFPPHARTSLRSTPPHREIAKVFAPPRASQRGESDYAGVWGRRGYDLGEGWWGRGFWRGLAGMECGEG